MHYSHGGATCISIDFRIYPPSFLHYILLCLIGTAVISCSTYTRFERDIVVVQVRTYFSFIYSCIISILFFLQAF